MLNNLAISQGLRSGPVLSEPSSQKLLRLHHETFLEHGAHTRVDSELKVARRPSQEKRTFCVLNAFPGPIRTKGGKWLPRQTHHFYRTNDAPAVGLIDCSVRRWIVC